MLNMSKRLEFNNNNIRNNFTLFMNKKQWAFNSKKYQPEQVNKRLIHFKPDQLYEENTKNNWKIFAKQFSEMNITENDISQMKFQDFLALKQIMSRTLADLAQETQQSRQNLSKYESQNKKLDEQLKKLSQIEKANKRIEQDVKQQLQELKQNQRIIFRESNGGFQDQDLSQITNK